jgi:hypothetical protein
MRMRQAELKIATDSQSWRRVETGRFGMSRKAVIMTPAMFPMVLTP